MSPIIDDLRIDAEIPTKSIKPGASVEVSLRFLNLATRARTIFLLCEEALRHGQSTFYLEREGSAPPWVQPERRSSGKPVTEADFHHIAARGKLVFTQTLRLPTDLAPGKYPVRWVYENRVEGLPAGTPGGGEPIPGIWLGTLEDRFTVSVAGRRWGSGLGPIPGR